jgi:hypothetical protein
MQNMQRRRNAEMKDVLLFIEMLRKLESLKRQTNTIKRNLSTLMERSNGRRNLLKLDSSSNNNSWLLDNARTSRPRVSRQRSIFPHAFSNRAKLIRNWTKPPSNKNVSNAKFLRQRR